MTTNSRFVGKGQFCSLTFAGIPSTVGTYSFIQQMFTSIERKEYARYITQINKWKARLPLTEDIGDIVILCCDEDLRGAQEYCKYLQTLQMRLNPGQRGIAVKAKLMYDLVPAGTPKLSGKAKILDSFTFAFLYVTHRVDALNSYCHQMCIVKQLEEKDKEGCVCVVYADGVDPSSSHSSSLLRPLLHVRANDRSTDTESALIKTLESRLYMRDSREKSFVPTNYIEAHELEDVERLKLKTLAAQ